jgi:hypothetical protein
VFQHKKQEAELKRNQLEEDLKENHPYFDKPLFTIGRDSNLRKFCQMVVAAKYTRNRDLNHDQNNDHYKQFHKVVYWYFSKYLLYLLYPLSYFLVILHV